MENPERLSKPRNDRTASEGEGNHSGEAKERLLFQHRELLVGLGLLEF